MLGKIPGNRNIEPFRPFLRFFPGTWTEFGIFWDYWCPVMTGIHLTTESYFYPQLSERWTQHGHREPEQKGRWKYLAVLKLQHVFQNKSSNFIYVFEGVLEFSFDFILHFWSLLKSSELLEFLWKSSQCKECFNAERAAFTLTFCTVLICLLITFLNEKIITFYTFNLMDLTKIV